MENIKDYTIKEVADMLGVSKQAIQYHVKNLPTNCYRIITKGKQRQIMINHSGLLVIKEKVTNKETDKTPSKSDNQQIQTDKEKMDILELTHQLDTIKLENSNYKEQLDLFKQQNEQQREQIETLMKLLDQAQRLQYMAEQKIQLLEQKAEQTTEQEQPKNKWFNWFKS